MTRLYCYFCRRSLSERVFSRQSEDSAFRLCDDCISQMETEGILTTTITIENEKMVQTILQRREGGEREVETPAGFVDLVTNEYVIEIKHVNAWKDGTKVLVYGFYFPGLKPRVHLFGSYTRSFKVMVEEIFIKLGITTTWERDPLDAPSLSQ